MAEKVHFNQSREAAIVRTPVIDVKLIRWDWDSVSVLDHTPVTLTPFVLQYQFQKTIKSPAGGCTIDLIPQIGDTHFMDYINVMDVIQIFEFGVMKFQGYVRRVAATGRIMPDGKPVRTVSVVATAFGNLLLEGQIGLNMYLQLADFVDMATQMQNFAIKLVDVINGGGKYSDMVGSIVNEYLSYIGQLSQSTGYSNYINMYLDLTTAVAGRVVDGTPSDIQLFYSNAEEMTLWSILQKIAETPVNEIWFDDGPRSVYVESSKIQLADSKTYLVFRQTPFNGTVSNGVESQLFDSLDSVVVPLTYLTGYSLNKTMDESYSYYMVAPAIWKMGGGSDAGSNMSMIAQGYPIFDSKNFNKYLYRPLQKELFYDRLYDPSTSSTGLDGQSSQIKNEVQDIANSFKNWFQNNDKFLNGQFNINVPSDSKMDPRIGDKISFDGLDDAFFYVEGISHSWVYGGRVQSDLSVTRGYGLGKPIQLKDKLFKRAKFPLGKQFG